METQKPSSLKPTDSTTSLPDVAHEAGLEKFPALSWVGMTGIEVPVLLPSPEGTYRQSARVDAQVSLDRHPSRGIHMSRLYLIVQNFATKPLSAGLLQEMVAEFLRTHETLSSSARLAVHLEWPLLRAALKSANSAWRTYPVTLTFESKNGVSSYFVETTITYSSTCPASAALSRQLIQENFRRQFQGQDLHFDDLHQWLGTSEGILATPHAQRSFAKVKVQLKTGAEFSPENLIDLVEETLQTAVQGAVKREDEQEFALRNGQNLMFCEDAGRRVLKALDAQPEIADFIAEINHVESLHPHSAVSFVRKSLTNSQLVFS